MENHKNNYNVFEFVWKNCCSAICYTEYHYNENWMCLPLFPVNKNIFVYNYLKMQIINAKVINAKLQYFSGKARKFDQNLPYLICLAIMEVLPVFWNSVKNSWFLSKSETEEYCSCVNNFEKKLI